MGPPVPGYPLGVKAFAIYTAMRLALFVACYAAFGGLYYAAFGRTGALVWPFLAAIVVSSLLSLKLLAPQRERFAEIVEARATRASANFEKRRAREDAD
jgi:uncharacterized protein DUF4229